MLKLGALVGPTAVGKTEISIHLAQSIGGEIISCDSMQVYIGMDIGTAKASMAERQKVPHHMIDIVQPDVNFTVADYQKMVKTKIHSINERARIPILVGGTGLYYQAVVDNYDFYPMESRDAVRRKWDQIYEEKGLEYIYQQVLRVDQDYAAIVGCNDKKRLIRALEVYELTGQSFSDIQTRNKDTYKLAAVGLYLDRVELYRRIDQRVDNMIAAGLVEEVVQLREKGYDLSMNSMQALGYKQVYSYLEGMLNWDETVQEIKQETRRFAKRQYTWFNKDKRIHWVNVADYPDSSHLMEKIYAFVEGQLCKM